MKKSRFRKAMILLLVLVAVFAFTTTAFAGDPDIYKYGEHVEGGTSQDQGDASRDELNSMDVHPTEIDWLGESGWKFRGYRYYGGAYGTELKSIYSEDQTYCADYISGAVGYRYYMMMSIASPNESDELIYSGRLYF